MDISGKTAVVTGGGNGIGAAICEAFAGAGCNVVVADLEYDAAEKVAEAVKARDVRSLPLAVDVTSEESVTKLADVAFDTFGSVEILVNNAGVAQPTKPLYETTSADLDWVMSVNLGGVMNGIRAFVPRFIDAGAPAYVVNTGSEHCLGVPHLGGGLYTASKHAILGLSDVLRRELPDHVGLSVLCPGIVASSLWRSSERRQDSFGGSESAAAQVGEFMQSVGMPAAEVAGRVLEGIRDETFYIMTHSYAVGLAEERWQDISAAFAEQAPRQDGDDKYDLRKMGL